MMNRCVIVSALERYVLGKATANIAKTHKRRFHCELNPVKPGRLILNSSIDMRVAPAAFAIDNACCKVEVNLSSPSLKTSELTALNSQLNVSVCEHSTHNELIVDVPSNPLLQKLEHPVCVNVAIPQHYSVQLTGQGKNSVELSKLECDFVDVKLEDGNCELHNIKALNTTVQGENVDLTVSQPFIGNMTVNLTNGSIVADKMQGQDFLLSTMFGSISIDSLYAFNSSLSCNCGDIEIGNSHGSTKTKTVDGNVKIRSVDGDLTASINNGDMDINLTSHSDVNLFTNCGRVNITVPEHISSDVNIQTENLDVDHSLVLDIKSRDMKSTTMEGTLGELDECALPLCRSINVRASSVKFGVMDWITAQQLKFSTDFDDVKL